MADKFQELICSVDSLQLYLDWFDNAALPFWLKNAVDKNDLFYEAFDFSGQPLLESDLRIRTGMRQVFVFSEVYNSGVSRDPKLLEVANRLAHALRNVAWAPDGKPGWIARFKRDGTIISATRDFYDHTFVLLGLGALYKATHDPTYAAWIAETLAVLENFKNRVGGFDEDDKQTLPRRQNPHMHYFEVCMYLFEWTGEAQYLRRADETYALFLNTFYDKERGLLREHFGPQWQVDQSYQSNRLEPGHMAEWIGLIRRYSALRAIEVDDLCHELLACIKRIGLNPSGFLYDEVDEHSVLVSTSRLWPQTEYIKALTFESVAQKNHELMIEAQAFTAATMERYFKTTPPGTWIDQFSVEGKPCVGQIPASILYHAFTVVSTIREAKLK